MYIFKLQNSKKQITSILILCYLKLKIINIMIHA